MNERSRKEGAEALGALPYERRGFSAGMAQPIKKRARNMPTANVRKGSVKEGSWRSWYKVLAPEKEKQAAAIQIRTLPKMGKESRVYPRAMAGKTRQSKAAGMPIQILTHFLSANRDIKLTVRKTAKGKVGKR